MSGGKREKTRSIVETGGKLLPSSVDTEEVLIGGMLLESNMLEEALIEIKSPDVFYLENHKIIFEALRDMYKSNTQIDIITVTNYLRKKGSLDTVGGAYFVSKLTSRVASSANWRAYVAYLNDLYIKRTLIFIGDEIVKLGFNHESDAEELLAKANKELTAISEASIRSNTQTSKELFKAQIEYNDKLLANKGKILGVPSGFPTIDLNTGGFQNSDLIILAARPGMGKTSLALSFSTNAAASGVPVGFFSLEMSNKQLYARVVSQNTSVPLEKILRTGMNEYDLMSVLNKADWFTGLNVQFDDTGGITLFELINKARIFKRKHKVGMIVIDYLQLIVNVSKSGNREQEVSEIARALKTLAKELDIPVIALSQLSRANEKRPDHMPILSDLRTSGEIEQAADMVMFTHRPEYYGVTEMADGQSAAGVAILNIAKFRNGSPDNLLLKFNGSQVKFEDCNSNPWG